MTPLRHGKTICFVATSPVMPGVLTSEAPQQMGGAELQLKELSWRLADRGWNITFVLGDYGPTGDALRPDVKLVTAYAPHSRKPRLERTLVDPLRLWRALDEAQASVYFAHGVGTVTGLTALYCRARRRRFVVWMASDSDAQCHVPGVSRVPPSQRRLSLYGLRSAALLLAQSTVQQELARRHLRRESEIMPNLWPGPYVSDPPARASETVLWVGSIRPVKRPLLVPEVAALLPDIPFTMLGGPTRGEEALHEQLIAAARQTPNLQYAGFVPPNEIDQHYARAALLLCTSAVEGLPNTFLHAWGRSKPVVSTYDPGRLLSEHGLGVLVNSVDEAAAAVGSLWQDPAQAGAIGLRAMEYVRSNHHPEAVVDHVEQLLAAL